MPESQTNFWNGHKIILWILLIGLIHGMIYITLVPPWQHYDEPGHFEYAWLIATQAQIPQPNDYDQNMRRELAASMLEHDFFDETMSRPNLISFSEPVWIGVPQTGDAPLYYGVVSIPLKLISTIDITTQLYVARGVSFILYLLTILIAYGTACTLTPAGNPLRWMLPLTLALLPGFTDLMTSVNNDAGAVAAFSFFIWGSTKMIRGGVTWKRLLWVLGSALLCWFTKRTVLIAVPLSLIPITLGLLRGNKHKYAWAGLIAIAILTILASFGWDDAAHWQFVTKHNLPTRVPSTEAPLGDHVLRLSVSSEIPRPMLSQSIPAATLNGQKVTAGAWIWADDLAQASIRIYDETKQILAAETFEITTEPQFFTVSTSIPVETATIQIALSGQGENREVFFDGIVLIPGHPTADTYPQWANPAGNQGTWGGEPFQNLIRNSSAERAWPSLSLRAKNILARITPISDPSITFSSLLNWKIHQDYFKATTENLLRTFWAKFGWGHVSLMGPKPYRVLAFLTGITLVAAFIRMIRLRDQMPWPIIGFFTVTLLFIWAVTLLRGLASLGLLSNFAYIPVARYAYPVIIPMALLFNMGWLECSDHGKKWLRIPHKFSYAAYIAFFVFLDLLSIYSIYHFYYIS